MLGANQFFSSVFGFISNGNVCSVICNSDELSSAFVKKRSLLGLPNFLNLGFVS
ncbi:hypothetical protein HAX54_026769, partial [Datura stramonium]|nr:hypothetical protein [Datura stramonium]